MDILVVGGFLGAGKTTVLLALAKRLAGSRKVVVLENEVGKVGLDDQFLRENKLDVREIYSGCICCTLRLDLVTTLLKIEREIAPDLVILEPSGVAGPKQVVSALAGYGGEIERRLVLMLLDGSRFQKINALSLPLLQDSVETADLLALNKIDRIDSSEQEEIEREIKAFRPEVALFLLAAQEGTGMDLLMEAVEGKLEGAVSPAEATGPVANENPALPGAVVRAATATLRFDKPVAGADLLTSLGQSLAELTRQLEERGCTLIGHVKAVVRGRHAGYGMISITDVGCPPQQKGRLARTVSTLELTINAIVFGVEGLWLEQALQQVIVRCQKESASS